MGGWSLNRLIDILERKMGRFYIRGLMQYICFGMLGVFILDMLPIGYGRVMAFLSFDRAMILRGQIWRLFTFIFLPPSSSIIFIIFALYFYYFLGTTLEQRWGSRRFNLYYLFGILGGILGGFLFGYNTNTYLNMSLFLAFALLYPDYQILLFFILPVKMKYIALADAALMTYSFIMGTWPMRGCMILSLLPLFLFFGDTMLAEGKRIVRQIRYKLGK